ncbi:MAG: 2-C-methyl-D-erythritol 4-phosphate cytidylyltransferase [Ignavibacteriales bacterium]
MHIVESVGNGASPGAVTVVVAAGRSERFGYPKKQFVEVCGLPLLAHTLRALESSPLIEGIIVVVAPEDIEFTRGSIIPCSGCSRIIDVVAGGPSRQESVNKGVRRVARDVEWVLVHDGVRPNVSPELVEQVLAAARDTGAATPGLPVYETIKQSGPDGAVERTVDRRGLWRIQTPQAFRRDTLVRAHSSAVRSNLRATDDAALVEAIGVRVAITAGDEANIKVTTPGDFYIVESLLMRRAHAASASAAARVGIGYDVHKLVPGDGVVLGGVRVPGGFSLEGHSDADVLCHAVMDAVLGAAGERDIGCHFPDSDPAYKGARSLDLLRKVVDMASSRGFIVGNVDTVLVAEHPRIAAYVDGIKESLASALGITAADVGVKATTSEGVGFAGRGEAVCAWATAVLRRIGGETD